MIQRIGTLRPAGGLRADQFLVERHGDPAGDLVLQRQQIGCVAVEPLRPQMSVVLGIDQLCVEADPVSGALYAPLQYVAYTELSADLLRVDRLVAVGERGTA